MPIVRVACTWFVALVALVSALDGWAPMTSGLGTPGYHGSQAPKRTLVSLAALSSNDDNHRLTSAPLHPAPQPPRPERPHAAASRVLPDRFSQIRRHLVRAALPTGPPRVDATA
jgi:hypothetical protein